MKILYFGTYDPAYPRNRVLLRGLRENGVQIMECNDRSRFLLKYIRLAWRYWHMPNDFDAMLVAFPGQEAMILAKLLCKKPIIFDAFTSHFGGHVLDRGTHKPGGLVARYFRFIDMLSCRLANRVILDTNAHIDFFVKEFGLPREKFRRIFVGTDSSVFYPRAQNNSRNIFTVHFHGNFIPLQGTKYVIGAAHLLRNEPIRFRMIGRGQEYLATRRMADSMALDNIEWLDRVAYEQLSEYISKSDACLGIFGETQKARLVIPNKVYEAVACRKPVITMSSPAILELFKDRESALLCRSNDPEDLARKILELKNNPDLRAKIAEGGYTVFTEECTEKTIGRELLAIINGIVSSGILPR